MSDCRDACPDSLYDEPVRANGCSCNRPGGESCEDFVRLSMCLTGLMEELPRRRLPLPGTCTDSDNDPHVGLMDFARSQTRFPGVRRKYGSDLQGWGATGVFYPRDPPRTDQSGAEPTARGAGFPDPGSS